MYKAAEISNRAIRMRVGKLAGWWLVASLVVSVGHAPAHADERRQPPPSMWLNRGTVTARISGAPLGEVLDELGRLAGIRFEWPGRGDDDTVSFQFAELTVAQAVERLLRPRSYLVVYDRDSAEGQARRVVVLSTGSVALVAPGPVTADAVAEADVGLGIAPGLVDPDPAVRAQVLASLEFAVDDPRRNFVLTRLAADPDPGVREAALRAQQTTVRASVPRALPAGSHPRSHLR